MKIKCLKNKLSEDDLKSLGENYYRNQDYHISVGKEYMVLGLTFSFGGHSGKGCIVQYISDYGHIGHAPIQLFKFVDCRVSKYWELKIFEDGDIAMWPPSFYNEYYHDDLSENVQEVVEDFKKVKKLLDEEH